MKKGSSREKEDQIYRKEIGDDYQQIRKEILESKEIYDEHMGYNRIDTLQQYRDYKLKRKSVLIWLWKNIEEQQNEDRFNKYACQKVFEKAVYCIDRYLASTHLDENFYILLGATSFFVANKYQNTGDFLDTNYVYRMCEGKYDEDLVMTMELVIFQAINCDLNVLTPTEISFYIYKDFGAYLFQKKGNKSLVKNFATLEEYASSLTLDIMCDEKGIYYDYLTIAASSILCIFDHIIKEIREEFLEWLLTVYPIKISTLQSCREDIHAITVDKYSENSEEIKLEVIANTVEVLQKNLMAKSMTEEDNMFEKTPKRSRLATDDLSLTDTANTPNMDNKMCMEECSSRKTSPLLSFTHEEFDEYYNTPVKKQKCSSNYNIIVNSAITITKKHSINGPYNNLGELEQVSDLNQENVEENMMNHENILQHETSFNGLGTNHFDNDEICEKKGLECISHCILDEDDMQCESTGKIDNNISAKKRSFVLDEPLVMVDGTISFANSPVSKNKINQCHE